MSIVAWLCTTSFEPCRCRAGDLSGERFGRGSRPQQMTAFRLSVLVLGALTVAQFNQWRPLDRLIIGGVALLLLAYLWSKTSLRGVSLTRRIASDRAQVGQPISDQISLQNRSLIGKLWLEVR